MATLDLQPLSNETIETMGFRESQLWLVKIHDEVFGPFETESLKHYAFENEGQFEHALATNLEEVDYKRFWSYPSFQRRKSQNLNSQIHSGRFWIMDLGLKVGPLSFNDIDKKLETGLLGMTDHISVDNGQTWSKVYELEGFDRRAHEPEELPQAPTESIASVMEVNHEYNQPTDDMAAIAFMAKKQASVTPFKTDEFLLNHQSPAEVSASLKWTMPAMMVVLITVLSGGYFMFSEDETEVVISDVTERMTKKKKATRPAPKVAQPKVSPPRRQLTTFPKRAPASIEPAKVMPSRARASARMEEDRGYSTTIETHRDDERYEDPYYEQRDPRDGPVMEAREDRRNKRKEHSLVGGQEDVREDNLDAAMYGQPEEVEPYVEEVSDF